MFVHVTDHDECLLGHHGCQQKCNNFLGSFYCSCNSGYELKKDNKTCSGKRPLTLLQWPLSFEKHFSPPPFLPTHKGNSNRFAQRSLVDGYLLNCRSHYPCRYSFSNEIYSSSTMSFVFPDVNECTPVFVKSLNKTVIPAGCDQICHNTQGNYTCSCDLGYQLLYDGKRCRGKTVLQFFCNASEHKNNFS